MENFADYELVPPPANETPRQFLLRITGYDFTALTFMGKDYTWEEVREAGLMDTIKHMVEIAPSPSIVLRRKNNDNT